MNRRKVITLLAASPLLVNTLISRPVQKEKAVIDAFQKKYRDLRSISLRFSSDPIKGSLKAVRGGSYVIDLGTQAFVCDGKTVWTVQRKTQTVLIDNYDANSEEMSLDRVFFVLFNAYKPAGVITLQPGPRHSLSLQPSDASVMIGEIDLVSLMLDKNMLIESVIVSENDNTTSWDISDLQINPEIPARTFAYKPPKGWQVIDLR